MTYRATLTLSSLRGGEGTPRATQDSVRVSSADSFSVTMPLVPFTVRDTISADSATSSRPLSGLSINRPVNQSTSELNDNDGHKVSPWQVKDNRQ